MWDVRLVDGLSKVLPGGDPVALRGGLSGLVGERVGLQVALCPPPTRRQVPETRPRVIVEAPGSLVALWEVELVPVMLPCFAEHDDAYLAATPGLYPDLLRPSDGTVQFRHLGWHTLWLDLTLSAESTQVTVSVTEDGETTFRHQLAIDVVGRELPTSRVRNLQWLHSDAIADHYGVEPYSEAHWASLSSYLRAAADMGVTGVLTPLWTPPLDTAVGTYRRNTQLVGIRRGRAGYELDFTRLDRWLGLACRAGLVDVECPHLFTQWGAQHTPQIWVDGERAFGWDVTADSPVYREFLVDVVPQLRAYLERAVGVEHVWWHVSDEPHADNLGTYRNATAAVADLLSGAQVIDAVSDPGFAGLVRTPVVATDAVPGFDAAGLPVDWVYHCVSQTRGVANRFIAQRAVVHRVLAEQLWAGHAKGFLHWGFNFYYTALAKRLVDPYRDTCAGGAFPGGDPFIVYPGEDGQALPSLRHRVLSAAWQDLAAFELAEQVAGRAVVEGVLGRRLYGDSAGTAAEYLHRRRRIDDLIRGKKP